MDHFEQQVRETGYTPAEALAVLRAAAAARLTAADLATLLALAEAEPTAPDGLSGQEAAFLTAHGGLSAPPGGAEEPADLTILRLASALRLIRGALTVAEAAAQLALPPDTVRDRVRNGQLYGYSVAGTLYLPRWQIRDGGVLPHLPRVLASLPPETHPMTVTGFMTTPSDELDGQSPTRWLAAGGDPDRVLFALTALTSW